MAKSQKKRQSNGIADFIGELWQAAVNMRGSIERADSKRYVLPLIFLRLLSIRFEKRRRELKELIRQPQSPYFTEDSKGAESIVEDPEEQPGFAAAASIDEVREYSYALSPGRFLGSREPDEEGEPIEELFPELTAPLKAQMAERRRLQEAIERNLDSISKERHANLN